nr:Protein C56E6.4 [Haemonchus contortus]
MECQHMHFQKKQLAKGMNYVLELIARRFNVNPMKLCDMDGRKITEPSQLMSRGAYVLVAAGQSFRDTWYFLPDNAIDTSTNQERVEDRMDQRDRLLQRRERRERAKLKSQKAVTKTEKTSTDRYRLETVQPGRRFGNTYN